MKILLDVNVVIDLLLERPQWVTEARKVAEAALGGRVEAVVCAASIGTIHYLIRKQTTAERARIAIDRCLAAFRPLAVDMDILLRAMKIHGPDFEDDIVIASAESDGCDFIVTRDLHDFALSTVKAVTPAAMVEILSA